jgi:hypothetical protein
MNYIGLVHEHSKNINWIGAILLLIMCAPRGLDPGPLVVTVVSLPL